MRFTATLTLTLLIPCAVAAQTDAASGSGHFDGWPGSAQWGEDKQSFEATRSSIRPRLGLLTVAESGFGWRLAFTDSEGTFFRWEEVSAWCSAPGRLLVRIGEAQGPVSFDKLEPADLTTIVDEYFERYAAATGPSGPDPECTHAALRLPGTHDRIIELLEAASAENR